MVRNATWTLSIFCRDGNPPPDWNLVCQAFPTLAVLLYSTDETVLADACWAVSFLSEGDNNKIQAVIESGVVRRIVELLRHSSPSVQTPALRAVGNIVTGTDAQTQTIINAGCLDASSHLLKSPKVGLRKEACWMISNITAGIQAQIQAVIHANLVLPLIEILKNDDDFQIKKEAMWAIVNAISGGNREQIMYLVECGSIEPLCDLLDCADIKIIPVVLEALENMLNVGKDSANNGKNPVADLIEEAKGLDKIKEFQQHETDNISQKSCNIIDKYFTF